MKMTGKIVVKFGSEHDYCALLPVVHKIEEKTGFNFVSTDDVNSFEIVKDHPITTGVWEIRDVLKEYKLDATITVLTDYEVKHG